MPTIINQDSAGNTYWGYIDSVLGNQHITLTNAEVINFLAAAYGLNTNKWNGSSDNGATNLTYGLRFPVAWETKTGAISGSFSAGSGVSTIRCGINFWTGQYGFCSNNTTGLNWISSYSFSYASAPSPSFRYMLVNDYSYIFVNVGGGSNGRNTQGFVLYMGWLKNPGYPGNQYPRNFAYMLNSTSALRATLVNATGTTNFSTAANSITNPTITCEVATPGADATDIIFRDDTSPNNAIGKPYNMISLPSSFTVGNIYTNNGVDPDGGDNNKWLCVGDWGSRKLGVRVWTEGYI